MKTVMCILLFVVPFYSHAAPDSGELKVSSAIDHLVRNVEDRHISHHEFADSIALLIDRTNKSGIAIPTDRLIKLYAPVYEIFSSDPDLKESLINYYFYLSYNALLLNKQGASIYFLEKADRMIFEVTGQKSISVTSRYSDIYRMTKNYGKAIENFAEDSAYIYSFPELIREGKLHPNIARVSVDVLVPLIEVYTLLDDVERAKAHFALLNSIVQELHKAYPDKLGVYPEIKFYMQLTALRIALKEKGEETVIKKMLEELEVYFERPDYDIMHYYEYIAIKFDYHLYMKDYKRCAALINDLVNTGLKGMFLPSVLRSKALLLKEQGYYDTAYAVLDEALEEYDKYIAAMSEEYDDLLYAYTDSEFTKQELEVARQVGRTRAMYIFALVSFFLAAGIIYYAISRKKSKKVKKQIYEMNRLTEFLVASMEDAKLAGAMEAQKRLGQDLHDSVSANIAVLMHKIEHMYNSLQQDNGRRAGTDDMKELYVMAEACYNTSREKSHDLFFSTSNTDILSFKRKIQQLFEQALEQTHDTQVLIDEEAISQLEITYRIELLRILQELLINIIKHARASSVSLLVYSDMDEVIFELVDDGNGFDVKAALSSGRNLGIQSVHNRVSEMRGRLDIISDKQGTRIGIILPVVYQYSA